MSNLRFLRKYELHIKTQNREKIITDPLRISFNATKSLLNNDLNKMQCSIYGLNSDSRELLQKYENDKTKLIQAELKVGYQNNIISVFSGQIQKGTVQLDTTSGYYVTNLEIVDGGYDYFNSYVNTTVTGKDNAINECINAMSNTTKGVIGKQAELSRPKVLIGNPVELIKSALDKDEFLSIDSGKLSILKDNEAKKGYIPKINANTGLISTPEKKDKQVVFTTVLNPYITLGGQIELNSFVSPDLDGVYKVQEIVYSGDNYGDNWQQVVKCKYISDTVLL